MKKILILFSALSFVALTFNSCSSDPCKDKTAATLCNSNGTLVDKNGTCACNCNAGYEGADCKTLTITSLIGEWNQTSSAVIGSNQNLRTGKTTISQDGTNVGRIRITNLNQYFGCSNGGNITDVICYATIQGDLILDETAQCGIVFRGKGVKQSDGSWKFNYTATDSDGVHNCETILRK